jgi:hypothetical protein
MKPGYPTGSFLHLKRGDSDTNDPPFPPLELNIAIVGAGVAGLSTAIALRRQKHSVTVFEATPVLSEVSRFQSDCPYVSHDSLGWCRYTCLT